MPMAACYRMAGNRFGLLTGIQQSQRVASTSIHHLDGTLGSRGWAVHHSRLVSDELVKHFSDKQTCSILANIPRFMLQCWPMISSPWGLDGSIFPAIF